MAVAQAILTDLRYRLTELYGPRLDRLLLFGSQARGDAADGSDVDVLVVLHDEVRPGEEIRRTGGIVAELSLANDLVISCSFISSRRFIAEKSPFLLNVRREGIAI
jgi:predicted nucleotidyltransferase